MRVLFLVLIVSVSSVLGQQGATLSGRVVQNERPESKAVVALRSDEKPSASFTTTADDYGNFRFENVPPGRYQVHTGGAENAHRAIGVGASDRVQLRAGETRVITLRLEMPPIRETVTISAGEQQPIEEVAKSVDTIGAQEMRDRADFALIESLRSIPGLRVQQLGGFGRTASIKIRGLRTQDTAVLLDGIRFRDPAAISGDASPFLSDITLTSVSELEVLRGSGSSLYGTNAIGGVIDLKTPRASAGTHGQLSAAGGGLGLSRFRGNISNAEGTGKFGISAALARTDYREGIDGNDDANSTNAQLRIDSNPGRWEFPSFSGRLFFSDAYARLNANPDTLGHTSFDNSSVIDAKPGINFLLDTDDPDDLQRSRFFSGQFVVAHQFTNEIVLNAYYQGLATRRKNETGAGGPGFQSESASLLDGSINTGNATLNWAPNRTHNVKIGYEFERETFGNDGLTPDGTGNFFTRASQSSNTLFAQDVVSLFEGRFQIAGGLRAQFFGLGDPEFSIANAPFSNLDLEDPPAAFTFDAAASYFFRSSGTKLRAHVGNGYRVPSLYERYGTFFSTFFGPEFIALGDPRLKPEKSIAFDAGIEQYLAGEKVKLTAVFFYTELTDIIGYGNAVEDIGTTPRPFGGYVNQKGGIARGGEFSGTVKPTGSTEVFASYTFTNSDQLVPQISGSGVVETLGIPKHQFTLVATQRFERFWINADLLATSDYLAPIFSNSTFNSYVYRFGGNRRIDLTAGYTFPINKDRFSLRVFGTVENLLDQEYYDNGFKTSGRNGRAGLSFGF